MATEQADTQIDVIDLVAEEVALRQQMSTVVKMLLARKGMTTKALLASIPTLKKQALYDRLNAKKDWEAHELRLLARVFGVSVDTFFMNPDDIFPSGPRPPEGRDNALPDGMTTNVVRLRARRSRQATARRKAA